MHEKNNKITYKKKLIGQLVAIMLLITTIKHCKENRKPENIIAMELSEEQSEHTSEEQSEESEDEESEQSSEEQSEHSSSTKRSEKSENSTGEALTEEIYRTAMRARLILEYTRICNDYMQNCTCPNTYSTDHQKQQIYKYIEENIKTISLICLLEDTLNEYMEIIELYEKTQANNSTEEQQTLMKAEIKTVRTAITSYLTKFFANESSFICRKYIGKNIKKMRDSEFAESARSNVEHPLEDEQDLAYEVKKEVCVLKTATKQKIAKYYQNKKKSLNTDMKEIRKQIMLDVSKLTDQISKIAKDSIIQKIGQTNKTGILATNLNENLLAGDIEKTAKNEKLRVEFINEDLLVEDLEKMVKNEKPRAKLIEQILKEEYLWLHKSAFLYGLEALQQEVDMDKSTSMCDIEAAFFKVSNRIQEVNKCIDLYDNITVSDSWSDISSDDKFNYCSLTTIEYIMQYIKYMNCRIARYHEAYEKYILEDESALYTNLCSLLKYLMNLDLIKTIYFYLEEIIVKVIEKSREILKESDKALLVPYIKNIIEKLYIHALVVMEKIHAEELYQKLKSIDIASYEPSAKIKKVWNTWGTGIINKANDKVEEILNEGLKTIPKMSKAIRKILKEKYAEKLNEFYKLIKQTQEKHYQTAYNALQQIGHYLYNFNNYMGYDSKGELVETPQNIFLEYEFQIRENVKQKGNTSQEAKEALADAECNAMILDCIIPRRTQISIENIERRFKKIHRPKLEELIDYLTEHDIYDERYVPSESDEEDHQEKKEEALSEKENFGHTTIQKPLDEGKSDVPATSSLPLHILATNHIQKNTEEVKEKAEEVPSEKKEALSEKNNSGHNMLQIETDENNSKAPKTSNLQIHTTDTNHMQPNTGGPGEKTETEEEQPQDFLAGKRERSSH